MFVVFDPSVFDAEGAIESFTGRFKLQLPAEAAAPADTASTEGDNSFVPPAPTGSAAADSPAKEPVSGGDFEVDLVPPASN